MPTPLLISKADFAGRIDISANLDADKKLNPQILHAQDFDLRDLMGDKMYWSMVANYKAGNAGNPIVQGFTAPWDKLFTGEAYINDGVSFDFEGLKPVIIYFAGARLIKELDMHITPNAIMAKRNEFSDPVELKEKAFRATQYQNAGLAYWNMAKGYLDVKSALFPHWEIACGTNRKASARPKTIAVSNIDNTNYNDDARSDLYYR